MFWYVLFKPCIKSLVFQDAEGTRLNQAYYQLMVLRTVPCNQSIDWMLVESHDPQFLWTTCKRRISHEFPWSSASKKSGKLFSWNPLFIAKKKSPNVRWSLILLWVADIFADDLPRLSRNPINFPNQIAIWRSFLHINPMEIITKVSHQNHQISHY